MQTPGIELRPILIMTAPGHHHFNQVFYTDVRIPLSNVVGEVNDGWNVAMSTLGFERGTAGMLENIRYGAVVQRDRKSVVEGKSVSVRVGIVGRRSLKKK